MSAGQLDSTAGFGLNDEMIRIASKEMQALMRQALESEHAEVKAKMDWNWERTLVLEEKIAAAVNAGLRHDDLVEEMELLRRQSWKLGERGEAIDLENLEIAVVDNGVPGARWRPTTAEPF